MLFSVGLDTLKLAICLGDANGQVEACGVSGRNGRVSVIMGRRSSVGGAM